MSNKEPKSATRKTQKNSIPKMAGRANGRGSTKADMKNRVEASDKFLKHAKNERID
jgi:hypothetical protein